VYYFSSPDGADLGGGGAGGGDEETSEVSEAEPHEIEACKEAILK